MYQFNPKADSTRAEVAATLHRYIKLTIGPSNAQGWAKNNDGQFMYYKDGETVTGLQTGWVMDGDNWYFFSGNTQLTGWQDIGSNGSNKRYYFTKDGMTYYKIDYVYWKGDMLFYILNIVAMLIGSAAEEIGWRGFLLPNLQKKYTPFISSIIVGILWGIWHLNFTGGIGGFVLYTVTIIEMSILMTWVYNKSKGSIFLMSVWHLIINLTSHIFLWDRFLSTNG